MEHTESIQKDNIFRHILFRIALFGIVGVLSYFVITEGRGDPMGFGMFYTLVFTAIFIIVFGLIDSILLFVRKKYRKFKANMIMFGMISLITILMILFLSI